MPSLKIQVFCGFFLAGGLVPALGDGAQGITSYPTSFFADFRPNTANDMVTRLPGFTLDTGSTARGFAGTAGNVLIDGVRPTAKTDNLNAILSRIPASSVEHIDVIRGSAPGIDMQGQSVVANIVHRAGASSQTIITAANTLVENGEWAPSGNIEYHGQSGSLRYEGNFGRTIDIWNDAPGLGYRRLTQAGGAPQIDTVHSSGILQLGYIAHGAFTSPLFGGEWTNNLTLQTNDATDSIVYSGYGGSRFDSATRKRNGEFGSHWQKTLGDFNLETLVLQRLGKEADSNTSAQSSGSAVFFGNSSTGESIARVTARYAASANLNMEIGGEGAYNFLDARSSFVSNGAVVALPNANVSVNEKRGEVFANMSWKITPKWSLEAGTRFEYSRIGETGDTVMSRSFFYAKPRVLLTWDPEEDTQLRLRLERKVGQLNFSDFVASSGLSTFGVAAGNADLRPDQRWQYEADAEKRFWGKGALVLSFLHEDITDLEDYTPVGGGLDAPGNIPHATSDQISLTGTLPLDFLGLKNALFKPTFYWYLTSLADPVTGMERPISGQRDRRLQVEIDQDIQSLNSTWTLGGLPVSYSNTVWRISQISLVTIHAPYTYASWTWHAAPDLSLVVKADNFLPYRFEQELINYAGPRNTGALSSIQDVATRTRPRLYVELRKTF